ncbi:hypothetical protein [Paraburkholderia caribensis]|uniref:hypothetical protein n=1 Tax=Paraburkholderia caribensis TaxID=75105 RepID=UPI0015909FDC|nr:hypothetical protein [Paraburkholderia caribensis]
MRFGEPLGVAGHDVLFHEGAYVVAEGFYFLAVAEVHDVVPLFNLGFRVLGFWGFGVLGFWGFGVLGFWGFGVLGF